MTAATKTMGITLSRTITAAPDEVFDGWLDPACPGTTWHAAEKLILDAKVDGLFFWLYCNAAGQRTPHYGRFTLLDRPRKIQYTWVSPHTGGRESIVTVSLVPQGHDTLMTLQHENLPDDDGGRGHERGWGHFLGLFADRFTRP